ncbi:hypothetical protein BKA69DRAFT_659840 [Paraphysoderma sedebokerense]|nr:hypothetical protein BKA69DRAFT_659840 [Paraphysoderma sedebokerense]
MLTDLNVDETTTKTTSMTTRCLTIPVCTLEILAGSVGNASFEPEQFRALDLENSLDDVNRFALPMPWADPSRISSAPGSASKDSSLGASTVNGGLSILDGFESPASGSIKSDLLGRRLSLNTSASRDLPSPTMNDLGEDIPLMFDDWDGHQSKIADVSASQHRESLEKESNNFYLYAKNLMENAGTDNIYFEDIVTMQRKEVAAQGFYHILVLTTQRMMRPRQDTPYGSIRLEF